MSTQLTAGEAAGLDVAPKEQVEVVLGHPQRVAGCGMSLFQ